MRPGLCVTDELLPVRTPMPCGRDTMDHVRHVEGVTTRPAQGGLVEGVGNYEGEREVMMAFSWYCTHLY